MGTHAERVAGHDHVSREDQDEFAFESHHKAHRRHRRWPFRRRDRRPSRCATGKTRPLVSLDEGPRTRHEHRGARAGSSRCSRFPTARTARTTTAAPSRPATRPGITDGAAATVVASERTVERLGLKPLARIVGYSQAEVAPKWLFLAPIKGVRQAARPGGAADRGLRPDRDQRGLRRPDAGRRPRARFRLVQGERQRRRHRARPPDRRQRRAHRRHAAPRAGAAPGPATGWRPSALAAAAPWPWPSNASPNPMRRVAARSSWPPFSWPPSSVAVSCSIPWRSRPPCHRQSPPRSTPPTRQPWR